MRDFIMLMHDDAVARPTPEMWADYLSALRERGLLEGGSAIGRGRSFRKAGAPAAACTTLSGYVRLRAESLAEAEALLPGHPVWESGGTVEIRELPRD